MENREIKFRAWDTIDKKWLFGYDYPNLGGFNLVGEVTLMGELNSVQLERWNDVRIMQFTGLKDKNGVEIYEGDILKQFGNKKNIIVEFFNSAWRAYRIYILGTEIKTAALEVIGNIHQNPELL